MTPEQQRIAIAEVCGYKPFPVPHLNNEQKVWALSQKHANQITLGQWIWSLTPDYLNDLNAMHEAEGKFQTTLEKTSYMENLLFTMNEDPAGDGSWHECWDVCHAAAAQRAEAFLRTLGKWTNSNTFTTAG